MKILHKRRQLGLILVEIIIAMTISLIGFAAGYLMLKTGYISFNIGSTAVRAQQNIRLAVETMIKEFQETSADTVVIEVSGSAISFASARDADNNFSTTESGMPDWRKAVVYFLNSESKTIYRYEEAKANWETNFDPAIAFGVPEEVLEEMVTSVDATTFQISPNNLLSITIGFMKDAEGEGMPEELTTAIRLQN